ncbi:MAG: glycosyltransferase family 2 protein [Gammaproteobacteria bacterium]|nr:glycosyltransferase family 2 protein [Gammaproteobacteria bacterium]
MKKITIAICTYNRANNLSKLVAELRKQICPIECEILFIINNCTDNTEQVLTELANQPGMKLRFVHESSQGIAYARNRALVESMESSYLLFIDDDETPDSKHLVETAVNELEKGEVQCVGGKVTVEFGNNKRPKWLVDELLGFYAEINYGETPFIIRDESTPIWTSIIAYDMTIFRNNNQLRFNTRYNREGKGIGGGEDVIMFRDMLKVGVLMKYLPEMGVLHFVESWRINRRYFWRVHFVAGKKQGQFETGDYKTMFLGIPPFMGVQFISHLLNSVLLFLKRDNHYVRQGMNATHALGMICGRYLKWKQLGTRA